MRKIFCVGLVIVAFVGVHCYSEQNGNAVTDLFVNLKYSYKTDLVVNPDRFEIYVMEDSTFLYYYKDRVVMKITYEHTEMKAIKTDSGIEFSNKDQPLTIRYKYLSFRKGDSLGNLYGYDTAAAPIRIGIDSVWKSKISFPPNIISRNVDSLVAIKGSGSNRTEYYIAKSKPDISYCDSTILVFSEALKGVFFTFNDELDKSRKMKLFKMQCIYKPYFDSAANATVPGRQFLWEIGLTRNDEFAKKLLMEMR